MRITTTLQHWSYNRSESHSVMSDPMDYTVHGILQTRILEWVAFPFSRGSSQPRDRTHVSRIAGRFFTSWATREAQSYDKVRYELYQVSWKTLLADVHLIVGIINHWSFCIKRADQCPRHSACSCLINLDTLVLSDTVSIGVIVPKPGYMPVSELYNKLNQWYVSRKEKLLFLFKWNCILWRICYWIKSR